MLYGHWPLLIGSSTFCQAISAGEKRVFKLVSFHDRFSSVICVSPYCISTIFNFLSPFQLTSSFFSHLLLFTFSLSLSLPISVYLLVTLTTILLLLQSIHFRIFSSISNYNKRNPSRAKAGSPRMTTRSAGLWANNYGFRKLKHSTIILETARILAAIELGEGVSVSIVGTVMV